jgi:hypothetical protein
MAYLNDLVALHLPEELHGHAPPCPVVTACIPCRQPVQVTRHMTTAGSVYPSLKLLIMGILNTRQS